MGKIKILYVLLSLMLASCSTNTIQAPVRNQNNSINTHANSYVVKRNDTLYSIAWKSGKDYKDLAVWNGISTPFTIFSGQKLRLSPKKQPKKTKNKINYKKKLYKKHKVKGVTSNDYKKTLKLKWRWPIKVRQIEKNDGHTGVTLVGKRNELVRSGESGKVVYAGSGLKGYGNLLIIKHNEEFLSAYGFNKRLLVKEGAFIKRGQAIAEIGLDYKKRSILFFEIRRRGKPVSVTRYLPTL
jgi:lipoprotein NlpD